MCRNVMKLVKYCEIVYLRCLIVTPKAAELSFEPAFEYPRVEASRVAGPSRRGVLVQGGGQAQLDDCEWLFADMAVEVL